MEDNVLAEDQRSSKELDGEEEAYMDPNRD